MWKIRTDIGGTGAWTAGRCFRNTRTPKEAEMFDQRAHIRTWLAVMPVNTSGRTKAQIVAEAEATWMLPHLVTRLECDADCRCMKCFHRRLDETVRKSEEALNDSGIDIDRCADGHELQAHTFPDAPRVP
jgi:hypothetical protein